MHTVLVWTHIGLMMVAFGASPMGRLIVRFVLADVRDAETARTVLRAYAGVFTIGGIAVTAGVAIGIVLALNAGLAQSWLAGSLVLISVAGIGGAIPENRWIKRLLAAPGDGVFIVLREPGALWLALASPLIWLLILWLMIAKPA